VNRSVAPSSPARGTRWRPHERLNAHRGTTVGTVVYCCISGLATLGAVEFVAEFFPGVSVAAVVSAVCVGIFGLAGDAVISLWRD
jgi:hypothetical protein